MGALSTAGKNVALDALGGTAPAVSATHAALFDADAAVAPTGTASNDTFTLTGHGLAIGNLVTFTSLTGGAGLRTNYPYFVVSVPLASTFTLSETAGGAAVDFTTDVTASSMRRLVELSGGTPAYARKAVTWAAAVGGSKDETASPVFDVPAGATVDWMGLYSALTAGTLVALDDLTPETYAGQGTYTLSDTDIDLNLP